MFQNARLEYVNVTAHNNIVRVIDNQRHTHAQSLEKTEKLKLFYGIKW